MTLTLTVTDNAVEFLARVGYDPTYGARPLKRAIQTYLENRSQEDYLRADCGGLNSDVDASDLPGIPTWIVRSLLRQHWCFSAEKQVPA